MRNIKTVLLAIILYSLLPAATAHAASQAKTSLRKPSMDLLVSRVDAYWKFLLQGKRSSAAEYVAPSDREGFINLTIAQFSQPQLKSLELSADRTEAKVTMTVKRALPVGLVDAQVKEKWVFENNTWYNDFAFESKLTAGEGQPSQPSDRAQKREAAQRELRDRIRFEQTVLTFGTVRQGEIVPLSLKYSLEGKEPLWIKIRNSVSGMNIKGLNNHRLMPGQLRELTVSLNTSAFDGAVDEGFLLVPYSQGVEAPIEIRLQGFVYTPVSISPKLLEFNSAKKENVKEILVRNNSKSTFELKSFRSDKGMIAVESLPVTIPAGQELKLRVTLIRDVAEPDTSENLWIDFAQPVEKMTLIGLNVMINASAKKKQRKVDPTQSPEIQELIQKNKINLPNR